MRAQVHVPARADLASSSLSRAAGPGAGPLCAGPARQAHSLASIAIDAPIAHCKLEVGAIDDPEEREADAVADRVMRMAIPPTPISPTSVRVSRKCAGCEQEERLSRTPQGSAAAAFQGAEAPATVHDALRSPGEPLGAETRALFEPRFGHDFGSVRIHTGERAVRSAQSIAALAYTVGSDIVFARERYKPGEAEGQRLLAHELAHTIQQGSTIRRSSGGPAPLPGGTTPAATGRSGTSLSSFWSVGETPVTEPVYQSPPPAANPPPGAGPAAPTGCGTAFKGVSFALANAKGSSRTPGANFRFAQDGANHPLVGVNAVGPVTYKPEVTITAPSAATASNYEAGLIQNVLTSDRRAIYSGLSVVLQERATVTTAPATKPPLKDGAPRSSGLYDVDFAENGGGHPNILGGFTASGGKVSLVLPDAPGGPAWLNLLDDPAAQGPFTPGALTQFIQNDTFRTWVGVRHKPTGCVKTVHHIDWNTNWDLAVVVPALGLPSASWSTNTSDVTVANGDRKPAYIQGGPVPADGISRKVT